MGFGQKMQGASPVKQKDKVIFIRTVQDRINCSVNAADFCSDPLSAGAVSGPPCPCGIKERPKVFLDTLPGLTRSVLLRILPG